MWPGWCYDDNTEDVDNPLRCIFLDNDNRPTYFSAMSQAMATLCPGPNAYVMDINPEEVYLCGIFGQTEWPTLKERQLNASNPSDALVNTVSKRLTLRPHYLRLTLFFPRSMPSIQMEATLNCSGSGPSQDRHRQGEVVPCYSAKVTTETRVEVEILMFPHLISAVHYQWIGSIGSCDVCPGTESLVCPGVTLSRSKAPRQKGHSEYYAEGAN